MFPVLGIGEREKREAEVLAERPPARADPDVQRTDRWWQTSPLAAALEH